MNWKKKFVRNWGRLGMKFKETKIGIIPAHWEVQPIKEITEIVTDYVANGSFASLAENVIYKDEEDIAVLIRLVDYNNDFKGKFVFIDEHAYQFLEKSKLFGGEIIISNVGSNVGTVFRCPKLAYKMSLAPNSIMVKFKGNDDFYFHWLRGFNGQQMLKAIVTGSAQPKFNKTNFKEMLAPVPTIEEQNRIASILNTIDEKISINKKINNNLEQQAKALYKDWFLDFSPFSNDGNIPNDWRVGTAGDIIQLHDSKRVPLSGAERDKMGKIYPYYGATSLMDYVDNYLFDGIYLLLGEDGTVVDNLGFPILQYVYGQFWVNNHAHIITGKEGFSVEELYLFFSLTNIKSIVTGAVQQKVSQQNLKKVPAIIPSKETLSAFDDIIQPIFAQIRNLRDENICLADLRDTLLPKLMSGELDVSNIEI